MLEWTRTDGAWLGNGFRIERRSRDTWVLIDNTSASAQVVADPVLATMPSLKAAKHVAEAQHSSEALARDRKRLLSVALGSSALTLLLIEFPLAVIAAAVVGGAAVLELAATYLERFYGRAREVRQ